MDTRLATNLWHFATENDPSYEYQSKKIYILLCHCFAAVVVRSRNFKAENIILSKSYWPYLRQSFIS